MSVNENVELDTDGLQDQKLAVPEQPKEEKLEQVEVDLGYTDHSKNETKTKVVEKEESEKDNLSDVSDNVQKRIDKLTRKFREAERREKAALDYAKGWYD